MKSLRSRTLVLSVCLVLFLTRTPQVEVEAQSTVPTFRCSTSRSSCQALIDYVPINATTFADIQTLFGVKNLRSIFGANSLPLSTSPNATVPARRPTRIPFPCACSNGTGISRSRPLYTVKAGDGLDFIARNIFSNLMTYQQIARVNNISDPNLIQIGQELLIPLPCSCDDVDGMSVVHYGHVVPPRSTVASIADQFGTTESTLLRLNGLADPSDLMADSVLDIPLRACASMITNSSLDYPFLVPNGTYTFTANNCVQCKCDQANNWTLQCEPSPRGVKIPNWPRCPSMQCEGTNGLSLGNTTSSSSCGRTCSYTGYTNQTILTTLVNDSNCSTDGAQPTGGSTKIGFWWSSICPFFLLGSALFL